MSEKISCSWDKPSPGKHSEKPYSNGKEGTFECCAALPVSPADFGDEGNQQASCTLALPDLTLRWSALHRRNRDKGAESGSVAPEKQADSSAAASRSTDIQIFGDEIVLGTQGHLYLEGSVCEVLFC